ncbi:MAG: prepilin-type N-terminal cleavage/methylation domain-containing protein [Deltaproteobacteria bacterium]|jgi:prepilin-type N-terminal cleavage/methylation domain-containing protein|nr:prepilin-type N-terminal cleavage/methylation domain-containing protein [Deltaproteobacteria bacterium]
MKSQNSIGIITGAKSGFTLIEVLISLVVILFSFMAALTVLTSSMRSGTMAESQTLAVFLAESKLEELRHLTPSDMDSGTAIKEYFDRHGGEASEANHYFKRSVLLKRNTPSQFTHEVKVDVEWTGGRPVTYTSVIPAS